MTALTLAGPLLGGVGLFLLGMWLMTDGLKLAAGPALQRVLARSTETPLRAARYSSPAIPSSCIRLVNRL